MMEEKTTMADTYTLYLRQASNRQLWDHKGVYAFYLTGPGDFAAISGGTPPYAPLMLREPDNDPLYAALLAALKHVPDRCHLRVMTVDAYLHGAGEDPGALNETPAQRAARDYYRATRTDGLLSNVGQLRAIDAVLTERGIITSAARPLTPEERQHSGRLAKEAAALLKYDTGASPGEQKR